MKSLKDQIVKYGFFYKIISKMSYSYDGHNFGHVLTFLSPIVTIFDYFYHIFIDYII